MKDLSALRVADLKAELTKRSLPTTGLKKALYDRLQQAIDAEARDRIPQPEAPAEPVPEEMHSESKSSVAAEEQPEKQPPSPRQQEEVSAEQLRSDMDVQVDYEPEDAPETATIEQPEPVPENAHPATEEMMEVEEVQPTDTVLVNHLTRPFTQVALQEKLSQFGVPEYFWIDRIKSHCFCRYATADIARQLKQSLDGQKWPEGIGKHLSVTYMDFAEAQRRVSEEEKNQPQRIRGAVAPPPETERRVRRESETAKVKHTRARPSIPWRPLSDAEVEERRRKRKSVQ